MQVALELQDDLDWPPRPSSVTYATQPQWDVSANL